MPVTIDDTTYTNTLIFQHTLTGQYVRKDLEDVEDSKTYYHFEDFSFSTTYPQGEWRYYVFPYVTGSIEVENNKVYINGIETAPDATGLLQFGAYATPRTQTSTNNQKTWIQYEG